MPKYSVVISVYNKEKHISKTLKSVLAQTIQDFEIVILNDGSTDNSEAEILKFKDERIRYFSEENMGAGAGRNYVIKKAKGNYIALLDADDYWYSFYLEEQSRIIEKYPEESVFATNSEIIKGSKKIERNYSIDISNKTDLLTDFFKASYLTSIVNSSSTVIHKDVFEKVGYYDPSFKTGEDTDLFIRIGISYKIVFNTRVCTSILVLKDSLSRTAKKVAEKASFDKFEKYEPENPFLKKYIDLNRYSLCLLAKLEGNKEAFHNNFTKIDAHNLSKKQLFLLKQNKKTLQYLLKVKESLQGLGIRLTVFK